MQLVSAAEMMQYPEKLCIDYAYTSLCFCKNTEIKLEENKEVHHVVSMEHC